MDRLKVRVIIVTIALLLINIFVRFIYFSFEQDQKIGNNAIKNIPINIGNWIGEDFPLEEQVYKILETKFIVHRNYTANDKNVFLSVVYYPETKVDFHAPENCLAGEGTLINKKKAQITIKYRGNVIPLEINRLIRKTNNSAEIIYYFYKAGDFIGGNYITLRLNLIKNKFLNNKKSGALIRISTSLENENNQFGNDPEILLQFIKELYPYIEKYM